MPLAPHSTARQVRSARCLVLVGDGDYVGFFPPEHFFGVFVQGVDMVALGKGLQALFIPVGGGDEVDVGAVVEGFGVRGGQALLAGVDVMVELAVQIEPGRGAVDIVDVPFAHALGQVVEHAHPAEADDGGAVLCHGVASS